MATKCENDRNFQRQEKMGCKSGTIHDHKDAAHMSKAALFRPLYKNGLDQGHAMDRLASAFPHLNYKVGILGIPAAGSVELYRLANRNALHLLFTSLLAPRYGKMGFQCLMTMLLCFITWLLTSQQDLVSSWLRNAMKKNYSGGCVLWSK